MRLTDITDQSTIKNMEESTVQNPTPAPVQTSQPVPTTAVQNQPDGQPTPSPSQKGPAQKSKAPLFIGLGLVVFIVAVVIAFMMMKKPTTSMAPAKASPVAMKQAMSPTKAMTAEDTANALPAGNSDTQLNSDLQTIDTSIKKADSSMTDVDKGLNDQGDTLAE